MKKKFVVFMALVTLAVTSVMANTEIDLNYYLMPVMSRTIKSPNYQESYSYPSYFGLEPSFNFFLGKNPGFFDMGLNLDMGLHAITGKMKIKDRNGNVREQPDPFAGIGGFISVGPVFRLTPISIVSVSFTPGIQAGFDVAYKNLNKASEYGFLDYNIAVSLNAAAKLWLINKTGFHLGLNAGADVDIPFTGSWREGLGNKVGNWTSTGTANRKYGSGLNFRAFVGFAFQFGDRSSDR